MVDWLKHKALPVVGFVVVMVVGFFTLRWMVSAPPDSQPLKNLEVAWGDAIGQFKIEPVFPPEEDLAVGDVLAYVIEDKDVLAPFCTLPGSRQRSSAEIDFRTPSLKRSVKLAHVDVKKELEEFYAKLAVFPGTLKAPADDKQPPSTEPKLPTSGVARLFSREVLESDLPRAAFARLKSYANTSAAGAISADSQASARYGGSHQGSEEFQLSEVSTYGLPSARALEQLKKYCSDERTKDDCRESTVRQHLRHIIGDRIFVKILDPEGNEVYAVDVGIVIVSRVYLARSIVHRRRTGRAESGGLFASWFAGAGSRSASQAQEQPPSPPSEGSARTATDDALRNL
jgi:hypothetical protein